MCAKLIKSGTTEHILYDVYVKLLEKQNLESESKTDNCLGLKNTELLEAMKCPKTGLGCFLYDNITLKVYYILCISADNGHVTYLNEIEKLFFDNYVSTTAFNVTCQI